MLDWTAIFLTDIESSGMRISRNILDDFLRLNYVQKILNSYYDSEEDSAENEDEEEDKIDNKNVTKIYRYLKRLSSKSEEFYPNSKPGQIIEKLNLTQENNEIKPPAKKPKVKKAQKITSRDKGNPFNSLN